MTTEQPLALKLADKLEQQFPIGTAQHYLDGDAAAELRRLYEENVRLADDTALLRQALHALEYRGMSEWKVRQPAIAALKERLK